MKASPKHFEFMRELVIIDMITILVEERGLTITEAFNRVYNSTTLEKLSNPETGLYFQSARYVLSYLDDERAEKEDNSPVSAN